MADEAFRVLDVDRSGTISKAEYGVRTPSPLLVCSRPRCPAPQALSSSMHVCRRSACRNALQPSTGKSHAPKCQIPKAGIGWQSCRGVHITSIAEVYLAIVALLVVVDESTKININAKLLARLEPASHAHKLSCGTALTPARHPTVYIG